MSDIQARETLSFGQLSLWRSAEGIPIEETPKWHLTRLWRIPAGMSAQQATDRLSALIRRHEGLRTIYDSSLRVPDQIVLAAAPSGVQLFSHRDGTPEEAQEIVKQLAAQPFYLAREPGWRAGLITTDAGPAYVCLAFHHMAADAWSLNLLEQEWDASGSPDALPPAMQPRELAELQRSEKWTPRREAAVRYWQDLFARYPAPTGRQASISFSRKAHRLQAIISSPSLGPLLRTVAQKFDVTLPSAALAVALSTLETYGATPTEPLVLMASNRFDRRWQSAVTTMNQAAVLDTPPVTPDLAAFAKALEWACRVAYRHGCFDTDEFTRVTAEVRGAAVSYDYFFNYSAGPRGLDGPPWSPRSQLTTKVTDAPTQTGPRLDIRIAGQRELRLDIRADTELLPENSLRQFAETIGNRLIALATC